MTCWDATAVTGTKGHSMCTCANTAHQPFTHSIGEHISLEEPQLTWAKATHTLWGLSSNELVTSVNLKTHNTCVERLWGILACSRQATSPQGTGVGMRKQQSRGRIIPPSLQVPGQLWPSRKVLPRILKGLKMDFLPLMKVNCCAVVLSEGCLGWVCLSGLSLVCG